MTCTIRHSIYFICYTVLEGGVGPGPDLLNSGTARGAPGPHFGSRGGDVPCCTQN